MRAKQEPRSICGQYARRLTERIFAGRRPLLVLDPKRVEVLIQMAFHQGWEAGRREARAPQ